jgi:hypothetical protein
MFERVTKNGDSEKRYKNGQTLILQLGLGKLENASSLGMDGALVAKAKKTDWVGFEVPKTSKGLKFQYNASFFSNKNILVDLGM